MTQLVNYLKRVIIAEVFLLVKLRLCNIVKLRGLPKALANQSLPAKLVCLKTIVLGQVISLEISDLGFPQIRKWIIRSQFPIVLGRQFND